MDVALICAVCGRQAVSGITHPICKRRHDIDGVFTSLVYRGVAKKLVYQFKFQPYLTNLRYIVSDLFYEGLIQQELFFKINHAHAVLVPIPLHTARERSRGYNQSEILATDLGKRLGLPVKNLLTRTKPTVSQVGKTQKERRENIKGVFALKGKVDASTVLLIDDVLTSGATMNEAAKTLKRAGVKEVWGLALAHGL